MRLGGFLDLLLHGLQIEAGAFLHGRELDRGLSELRDLLLDMDEAPESYKNQSKLWIDPVSPVPQTDPEAG